MLLINCIKCKKNRSNLISFTKIRQDYAAFGQLDKMSKTSQCDMREDANLKNFRLE